MIIGYFSPGNCFISLPFVELNCHFSLMASIAHNNLTHQSMFFLIDCVGRRLINYSFVCVCVFVMFFQTVVKRELGNDLIDPLPGR